MTPFTIPDDSRGLLQRAESLVGERRRAIVEDLVVCLAWADLHGEPPTTEIDGGEELVTLGGDGTPAVRDLTLQELSIARGVHVLSTRAALADAFDLRHRLPRVWEQTLALRLEPWVARKVASMTRSLSMDAVALVDRAVSGAVAQSAARILDLVEGVVAEADQEARRARIAEARRRKGVWLARPDEETPGLRGIFARVEVADAVWLDATVQRVADRLAVDPDLRAQHHPELGEAFTADELRAAALGWLARPGDLAEILGILDQTEAQQRRRRPSAVLYVHLHQAALEGTPAVARAERLGPMLLDQLAGLLGHAAVSVKPVIDLHGGIATTAYEFPASVRERTHLRMGGEVFPYAVSVSRRLDADHAAEFDPTRPRGQTGDHNHAPLTRSNHRAKTHLGYRVTQRGPTTYHWTTPHGLARVVTPAGTTVTTAVEMAFADLIYDAAGISAA